MNLPIALVLLILFSGSILFNEGVDRVNRGSAKAITHLQQQK